MIQIGLGDSYCNGSWEPYSERSVTETLMHEIGHVLGFAHDDNPDSLMYYASYIEYQNCNPEELQVNPEDIPPETEQITQEEISQFTITTDKTSYKTGETVTVTGTVAPDTKSIPIFFENRDGEVVMALNLPVVDDKFLGRVITDTSTFFTPGQYTASIVLSDVSISTTFDYTLVIITDTATLPTDDGFDDTPGPDDTVGIGETVVAVVSSFNFDAEPYIPYPADANVIKHLNTIKIDNAGSLYGIDKNNNLVLLTAQTIDGENRMLSKFNSDGKLLSNKLIKIGEYENFYRSGNAGAYPFVIDSENNMYIGYGDWEIVRDEGLGYPNGHMILKFNENGDILNKISLEEDGLRLDGNMMGHGIVIDSQDNIFTFADNYDVDENYLGSILVKISSNGELISSTNVDHTGRVAISQDDNIYIQNSEQSPEYTVNEREIRTVQKITISKFDNDLNPIGSLEKEFSQVTLQDNHRPKSLIGVDQYEQFYFSGVTSNIDQTLDEGIKAGALLHELEVFKPINNFSTLDFVGSLKHNHETEMSQFNYRKDT